MILVSVFSILKNPMILMAVVSLGLMVGMPKLMDSSMSFHPLSPSDLY
jgi:hypothetical protein